VQLPVGGGVDVGSLRPISEAMGSAVKLFTMDGDGDGNDEEELLLMVVVSEGARESALFAPIELGNK